MPRNGSGVYASTAGIPVTSGTTISSTVFNNLIADIGNEITASLPVAGTAPMTGALRATLGSASAPGYTFSGDTNTGIYSPGADQVAIVTGGTAALTFSAAQVPTFSAKAVGKAFDVDAVTDVASATTTDIGAAATSEVRITGTTTITGFGTSNAGIVRRGLFAGALTLTHNATSLILPGGTNITTAANDTFVARSLGSGNWVVLQYQRALRPPLDTIAASTSVVSTSGTAIGFTGIPSWAKRVTMLFSGVSTSGTSNPLIQVGNSSYVTTGYLGTGSVFANGVSPTTANYTTGFGILGADAANVYHGRLVVELLSGNTWVGSGTFGISNAAVNYVTSGSIALAGTLDRIRVTTVGGTDTFDAGAINILWE